MTNNPRLKVEFNNQTKYRFPGKKLESIFASTLKESSLGCLADKKVEVSVAFVAEPAIAALNKQYRRKNGPTDILSFAEYEPVERLLKARQPIFLGELIVCPQYVAASAAAREIAFIDELSYVLAHGLLHLLGFSHGRKMYAIQQKVVDLEIKTNSKKNG